MKIVYVDIDVSGHHLSYLNALIKDNDNENILILPEYIEFIPVKQYVFNKIDFYKKSLFDYIKWIRQIRSIIKKENPDIVHFLYSDVFYKYFCLGLEGLNKKYKIISTVHALKKGKIGLMSLKRIALMSTNIVVHTHNICDIVQGFGIRNCKLIEYPYFAEQEKYDRNYSRHYFGIESSYPVLACLGSTRFDKGLDLFLNALQFVDGDFEVLIAGNESDIKYSTIKELSKQYSDRVHCYLKFLTDDEFNMALEASDFIIIPYRHMFNGASGPLLEGVGKGKTIIGARHGSIGSIITHNHLGFIFDSEDVDSITETITKAIKSNFSYDIVALNYRASLSCENFKRKYMDLYKD